MTRPEAWDAPGWAAWAVLALPACHRAARCYMGRSYRSIPYVPSPARYRLAAPAHGSADQVPPPAIMVGPVAAPASAARAALALLLAATVAAATVAPLLSSAYLCLF